MLRNVIYERIRWGMFGNRNSLGWFGKQLDKHITSLESGDYSSMPWIFCAFSERHTASKELAAKVLCEALDKMTFDDTDHKAALQTALTLLLDNSAMVRDTSRDYLTGQQAELDDRTFYKSKLGTKTVPEPS